MVDWAQHINKQINYSCESKEKEQIITFVPNAALLALLAPLPHAAAAAAAFAAGPAAAFATGLSALFSATPSSSGVGGLATEWRWRHCGDSIPTNCYLRPHGHGKHGAPWMRKRGWGGVGGGESFAKESTKRIESAWHSSHEQ